jgi:excisionase family DNA binding protein
MNTLDDEAAEPTGDISIEVAARYLGFSATFVTRLIAQGNLPAHDPAERHTIAAKDLIGYRHRIDERLAGLQELTAADEELGLDY